MEERLIETTENGQVDPIGCVEMGETVPMPTSYADATLETIKAAREAGTRAIEHYVTRRAELDAEYKARRNEIDAHLKALREACEPRVIQRTVRVAAKPKFAPKPVAQKRPVGRPPKQTDELSPGGKAMVDVLRVQGPLGTPTLARLANLNVSRVAQIAKDHPGLFTRQKGEGLRSLVTIGLK